MSCRFIERIHSPFPIASCHYISHHAVRKDSPTTPIRIVYDCNHHSSQNTLSLNDCLEVGPPFMKNLCTILLCLRFHKVAISTDIEKEFLQVNLLLMTKIIPGFYGHQRSQTLISPFCLVLPVHLSCFVLHCTATCNTRTRQWLQTCSPTFTRTTLLVVARALSKLFTTTKLQGTS